ncbi:MAG: PadR family transcriptional regulator [Lachnospira sp.]|nr:PadR family transcriptional regulator [Lachnospira sp.]
MVYQLSAGMLDACVLSVLEKEDAYGYILTQNIKNVVDISESSLYPILRRLQSDGCLITYDQPFAGRNRRYYRITELGTKRLDYLRKGWDEYKTCIDKVIY